MTDLITELLRHGLVCLYSIVVSETLRCIQSYPDDDGTPGYATPFRFAAIFARLSPSRLLRNRSDINFVGDLTTVTVDETAHRVTVDCGNCTG